MSTVRLPVIFVVDTSAQISPDTLESLREQLGRLQRRLAPDARVREALEIAVVTVGEDRRVAQAFAPLERFQPPQLTPWGGLHLGSGLVQALDLLSARLSDYRQRDLRAHRAWIVLLVGSRPDAARDTLLAVALSRLKTAEASRQVSVFTVGTEQADLNALTSLSARSPHYISTTRFPALFDWLIQALHTVAQHEPGAPIALPTARWDELATPATAWRQADPTTTQGQDFDAIDAHAAQAPESATGSIQALVRYLTAPCRTELEKARSLFRWITSHIMYDAPYIFGLGPRRPQDPISVLRSRICVCEGNALLFAALAQRAGLQAEYIMGPVRDCDVAYNPGEQELHAWNAVKIDGRWGLLDSTWGAGYCDAASREFRFAYKPFYFLTRPDILLYSHFPGEARWQLVASPLAEGEFEQRPLWSPIYFQARLKLLNYHTIRINTAGPIDILIEAPDHIGLLATLYRQQHELPNQTRVTQEGRRYRVRVTPPRPGEYHLRIFAGLKSRNLYYSAISYRITAM